MTLFTLLLVATKNCLRDKLKFSFLGWFFKEKKGRVRPKDWSFSDKFTMLMPASDTYFLEVSVHVSLKVATNDYFRDKESMKI